MKPIEIIAQDLFDKVRSRFTNLQMGDENGSVTADPTAARFFDFDFTVEGNNLGRVSVSINEVGNLKIFYSQGITENADSISQSIWYDFLKEMRFFAKRRLLRFDTRDITKGNLDKTDFQYLAQHGSKDNNMNESTMFGSSKTSHRKLEDTDLIIRHSEAIDPTKPGARSRKIKNLFIQNKEGERFKFPFIYLPGARAMQRHVANGGYPHDEIGKHLIKTCEEILKLSDFGRKVKHATLNDNAHGIIEKAGNKLKQLRHHMESMCKQGYYESWCESYAPSEGSMIELDDATMESLKDTFTVNKFDESLKDVFPILHAIMQEASEIDLEDVIKESDEEIDETTGEFKDEFAAFEGWTNAVVEGSLEPDALMALAELLQTNPDMTIGADGTQGIEALEGIGIVSDPLEKLITAKAGMTDGANTLLKDVIAEWLSKDDPEAAQELGLMPQQAQPVQQPAPARQPAPAEQPVAEGMWYGPEDFQDWLKDATHRVAQGKVKDWPELYSELVSDLGMKDETAERIAKRVYGHDKLAQYRVKPTDDLGNVANPDTDGDDDASFLANLRRQAKSGGIKPGADTGEKDESAIDPDADDKLIEKGSDEDIWKAVEGFLDKDKGTWTKGRPGIVAHCTREFGDEGGKKAAKAIMILSKKYPMKGDDASMDEVAKKSDIPAYQRKASGDKDWKVSTKDLEDEKTKSPTSSAGLERRKQELGMSEAQDILKLAGLTK